MATEHFSIEMDADGIVVLTLATPGVAVNTVTPDWVAAMSETFERFKADGQVQGVVITSAKSGFMAGADLKHILYETDAISVSDALEFSRRPSAMHRQIETLGKPVAAAINGFALGGGYELALACHRRIVADTPKAVVGLPEVTVGLLPGSGGTQRLSRMIGPGKALDVLLGGRSYRPDQALAAGLVDEVVPPAELIAAAKRWILSAPDAVRPWDVKGFTPKEGGIGLLELKFASMATTRTAMISAQYGDNYPAPLAILAAVFEGIQVPFDKGQLVESRYFAKLLVDPVARNIIRTTFVNKGLAQKGARRPADIPLSTFKAIGVLGAGMMGAGIAQVSAMAGIDVVLLDTSQAAADKSKAGIAKALARDVEKGRRTAEAAAALLARIRPTDDFSLLAGIDLVVEAVFEDTAIKADVTRKAVAATGADALFASNTSTLPISGLAKASARPDRFIGLHFFSPVDRMELVEVIRGEATSDATLAQALDFVAQIGKTPIVVNDSRGFYTSRVFQTFIHEGAAMLGEGVKPALIENAARQAGMAVGPLALLDEVTLDLPLKIVAQAIDEEGEAYAVPCGVPVMRRMQAAGRISRKAGGGFYDYPEGAPKRLWLAVGDLFPVADSQPDVAELKRRFLYIQALETVRCLDEGVLTHPADADIGAVLGWSFPSWTGGTLSLIDMVGVAHFVDTCDRMTAEHGKRFEPPKSLRAMAQAGRRFHEAPVAEVACAA